MGGDSNLQIITYSTRKHLDAHTLSRIRSHAQHYVQGQRGRGKGTRSGASHARNPLAPKCNMSTFCSTIDFDASQGPPGKTRSLRRSRRSKPAQEKEAMHIDFAPSMPVQSLGAALEPFDAFPVVLDNNFIYLFECYHKAWKWRQSKAELFSETVSNAALCHSWLAIANHLTRKNEVKAIEHEIKTIDIVYAGLEKLPTLSMKERETQSLSITWAILRLAIIKANHGELDEVISHLNALTSIAPSKETIEKSKFGDHIQCNIAILLLVNVAQMQHIDPPSSLEEVEAQGFELPIGSPLLQSPIATLIDRHVLDALKALTALCSMIHTTEHPYCYPAMHNKDQATGCMKIGLSLADFPSRDPNEGPTQWQDQLQGCLSLSALIFIWCFGRRNDATPTAISHVRYEVRQKLTPELMCRAVRDIGRSQPLIDLMLWMLIVCGSASENQEDKLYYSGLIRVLAPDFLERSFEELEHWGGVMPWIRARDGSPVEDFWCLTTGRQNDKGVSSELREEEQYVELLDQDQSVEDVRVSLKHRPVNNL